MALFDILSSSFTASTTRGRAPLRVEFTSDVTSYDMIVESGSAPDTITESGSELDTITE